MDSGDLNKCNHTFINTDYRYVETGWKGVQRQFIKICKDCLSIRRYSTMNDELELDDIFTHKDKEYVYFLKRYGIKVLEKLNEEI